MVCLLVPGCIPSGSWNLPKFLFNDGSLTLMYMASLIFLVSSLCFPVHYGETFWADWMSCCEYACKCMGEGALRCSLNLFSSVHPDSPMYCSVQLMLRYLYLYMTPLFVSLGSLSLGAIGNCLTAFVPLKCTWMPCFL